MEGVVVILFVWVVILALGQSRLSDRIQDLEFDLEKQVAELRALLVNKGTQHD